MDRIERMEAELEAVRALRERSPHATRANESKPRTDMPAEQYPVTIIGCVRGVDGWYTCGYDQRSRSIVPLREKTPSARNARNKQTTEEELNR